MRGLPKLKRVVPAASAWRRRVVVWAGVMRAIASVRPRSASPGGGLCQRETIGWGNASTRRQGASLQGASLSALIQDLPAGVRERALTHSSWVSQRTGSYERLEFLGDSVLGLAIASALFERYPEKEEGQLARIKAFVVSRPSCAQVAQSLEVPGLIMAAGPAPEQKRAEAAANPTVVGNVLEALIGACFLARGYDATAEAVVDAFSEQISYAVTTHVDHKTTLQEILAPRGVQPAYRLTEKEGPPHARVFTSEVSFDGNVQGRGQGTTIKMSEQAAAREALAALAAGRRPR
jgi:ribonuclease-3